MSDAKKKVDPELLRKVVAEVVGELLAEESKAPSSASAAPRAERVPSAPEPPSAARAHSAGKLGGTKPAHTPDEQDLPSWKKTPGEPSFGARKRPAPPRAPLPEPLNPEAVERIAAATPARLVQGRTGTRYLTDVYVGLRADHAIALDAVHSEVPEKFAADNGWLELKTRCTSKEQFLLYPDEGRRLEDASRKKLEAEGTRAPDIQLIAGDGLSAWALLENGPPLMKALERDLSRAGYSLGRPLFVRFARIGVQDEIGVTLGAKCTVILVGERPGLGTGDSLSIYTAFGPKLGQDNSEKDCISNVRKLGLDPDEASRRCTSLLQRTFAAGGGGVKLV
ncbi:ethanolamine ammonia-lyase light chain EutC [Myxococcota bacterium]|nr:ethanolamine ammonia-lyase light chain EutC [Myxococcota bacterium]